ncbi:hypothetical protein BSKO_04296 [Bryopsis sp. KO-2023]|nr:hypothetical protein BSKO_04296 [Bryopsis sp. KO-2023]
MESFLVDLVRIPSVNGLNDESRVAHRIVKEASRLGLESKLIAKAPDRPNVVVTVGKGPPKFLFVAHTDTVPVGDETKWTSPPFDGQISNGKLISRGACDNKAGIAVALYTLTKLKDLLPDGYNGSIQFTAVVDEESGASSELGLKHLLQERIVGGPECCGSIYTYLGRVVTIGHRGVLRFWIDVMGTPVHTGSSDWANGRRGASAVMALAEILCKIEALQWEKKTVPGFEKTPLTVTPGTLIEGGEGEGIVPERARALVDVRVPPEHDFDAIMDRMDGLIDGVIKARNGGDSAKLSADVVMKNRIPPYCIAPDHALVLACKEAIEGVTGQVPEVRGCGPANEAYMLGEAGIPCIAGMGPIGGNAHGIDEFVMCESLEETVEIYTRLVKQTLKNFM